MNAIANNTLESYLADSPPLQSAQTPPRTINDWLRPGAFSRLHDPAPAFVSGLSTSFLDRDYGRNLAGEIV